MPLLPLAAFVLAAVLSFALMPLVVRMAWATGYLDQPEARKLHAHATALLGGAGVFLAALIGWGLIMVRLPHAPADWEAYYLLAGAALSLAIGLWDDRFGMRASIKMLGQAAAATIVIAGGLVPRIGLPIGIEAALTLVALVGLMNAVNFLDNMNGMVGGLAAIALAGFAWTSIARGAAGVGTAQLALAGACVGFLPHNFPRARVFLGDAGSLLLGYSLGASALMAIQGAPPGWGRAGPLVMLAYPAFDMIFVILTRVRDGRPVYEGGRDHTNHRLASVLKCPKRTVLMLWASGAVLCASGLGILLLNRALPTLLTSGLWTILLLWSGRRLSFVPIAPRT
ncbi:MAG TPA: MraY family glycosyltransferase [Candidatus Eisenbacteria bacterium]|nr:MraY family glycosyltransferase [Candidatus Eisenbacteria bacterium]